MPKSPEIGHEIITPSRKNNVLEYGSGKETIVFIHGSGPGVSSWANWRIVIPKLANNYHIIAPDMAGFGFTERKDSDTYNRETWTKQLVEILDAMGVERASFVGNSFGGSMALAMAIYHPERVNKLVLMGSVGIKFPLPDGLDKVWGYEPSIDNMRALLDVFAYDRSLVNDELAKLRYEASIREGFQESFAKMFPYPRQRHLDALAHDEELIRSIPHNTLIIHGRDDKVIPLDTSLRLNQLIDNSQLHVFGRCGHWTQIERANEFVELLRNFID